MEAVCVAGQDVGARENQRTSGAGKEDQAAERGQSQMGPHGGCNAAWQEGQEAPGNRGKKRRPQYSAAQLTAIAHLAAEGLGYRKITQSPEMAKWGVHLEGVKEACKRYKACGGDMDKFLERKAGSGRPRTVASEGAVQEIRKIVDETPKASLTDLARQTGICRGTVQVG